MVHIVTTPCLSTAAICHFQLSCTGYRAPLQQLFNVGWGIMTLYCEQYLLILLGYTLGAGAWCIPFQSKFRIFCILQSTHAGEDIAQGSWKVICFPGTDVGIQVICNSSTFREHRHQDNLSYSKWAICGQVTLTKMSWQHMENIFTSGCDPSHCSYPQGCFCILHLIVIG